MNIFEVIFLSVIEGFTEFLPISSTGHLILLKSFFGIDVVGVDTFLIGIQFSAILAVFYLYPEIFKPYLRPRNWFNKQMNVVLIAIIPVLLTGFLCHKLIKTYLFGLIPVLIGLFLGGLFMFVFDLIYIIRSKNNKIQVNKIEDINYKQALIIGISQCVALWPGTSRSAATIVGGLLSGLSYELSAKFSFIIAVPVIAIAIFYDLYQSIQVLTLQMYFHIGLGMMISFLVAVLAMKGFIKILNYWKLMPFSIYRILLSMVLFIWMT